MEAPWTIYLSPSSTNVYDRTEAMNLAFFTIGRALSVAETLDDVLAVDGLMNHSKMRRRGIDVSTLPKGVRLRYETIEDSVDMFMRRVAVRISAEVK